MVHVFGGFIWNISGRVNGMFLENVSSGGGTLVTECGVFLEEYQEWYTELSQSVFSVCAALIILEIVCINLTITTFALGHLGVLFQ